MSQRVLIIGATSAIAAAAAQEWLRRGASLFLAARPGGKLDALMADLKVKAGPGQQIACGHFDALQSSHHHEVMLDQAAAMLGGLDVVLIAHGNLPDQQVCQADVPACRAALEVNALSVIDLLTLLANRLEAQGHGTLAVISSVAGDRGRQSNYVYGAAKGMVSIFLSGLRNRLAKQGVQVVTIKPGFVDTPMTAAFDKKGPLWASADQVGQGIVNAVAKGKNEVYLPGFWRLIMLIIRHIPERIFKRLSL